MGEKEEKKEEKKEKKRKNQEIFAQNPGTQLKEKEIVFTSGLLSNKINVGTVSASEGTGDLSVDSFLGQRKRNKKERKKRMTKNNKKLTKHHCTQPPLES